MTIDGTESPLDSRDHAGKQSFMPSRFRTGRRKRESYQITYPGDLFRKSYFGLQLGSVAVASNQPAPIYCDGPRPSRAGTFASFTA
jgi:hypothetical protein